MPIPRWDIKIEGWTGFGLDEIKWAGASTVVNVNSQEQAIPVFKGFDMESITVKGSNSSAIEKEKTSLISAMLGGLPPLENSSAMIRGIVAYVPQIPWIFSAAICNTFDTTSGNPAYGIRTGNYGYGSIMRGSYYDKVIALSPLNAAHHCHRAAEFICMKKLSEAVKEYEPSN
ncbi:hypothetical protein Tco_0303599 [Tanacetum coccineum]